MRLNHVSPATIRFWALLDTSVIALALPVTAQLFLGVIYWLNGLMGFDHVMPAFAPIHMFFVNLSGILVAVWAFARLLNPTGLLGLIDAIGRSAVAMLIVWFIIIEDAPPALWLFVATEGLGAIAQFRACLKESATST